MAAAAAAAAAVEITDGDEGLEPWDHSESSAVRTSSEASCTTGSTPEELAESRPTESSERDEPRTGRDRSDDETASSEGVLAERCLQLFSGHKPLQLISNQTYYA